MTLVKNLKNIATGATAALATGTLLPIFGAAGTITAGGAAICTTLGAIAGAIDSLFED